MQGLKIGWGIMNYAKVSYCNIKNKSCKNSQTLSIFKLKFIFLPIYAIFRQKTKLSVV
ncbi:hypothetical protein [uncultured Gammaproteobacteria bacterium]|nr:hypothetical protein [uncultured Gammaproteobacteria bacterium]